MILLLMMLHTCNPVTHKESVELHKKCIHELAEIPPGYEFDKKLEKCGQEYREREHECLP